VSAVTFVEGQTQVVNCTGYDCVDGAVLRGNLTQFVVEGDDMDYSNATGLSWNAAASQAGTSVPDGPNFLTSAHHRHPPTLTTHTHTDADANATKQRCHALVNSRAPPPLFIILL
jgi:hypothetical protein